MRSKTIVLLSSLMIALLLVSGCKAQNGRLDATAEALMESDATFTVQWSMKNNTSSAFTFEQGGMCRYEVMHESTGEWTKGVASQERLILKSGEVYRHTLSFVGLEKGFYRLFLIADAVEQPRAASAQVNFVIY